VPELTLGLCGRAIRLSAEDGRFIRAAARRYAAFVTAKRPDLRIGLELYGKAFGPFREEPRVVGDGRAWRVMRHDLDLELVPGLARGALLRTPAALDSLLRIVLGLELGREGGFLCHSAGIDGWLFPGVSGAGKSTLGGLAPKRRLLADELVGVHRGRLWGTPFRGDFKIGRNPASRPLEAIFLLDRKAPRGVTPTSKAAALAMLMRCMLCFSDDPRTARRLLASARRWVASVPAFVLSYDARTTRFAAVERMILESLR
jgi:hypothetical protein